MVAAWWALNDPEIVETVMAGRPPFAEEGLEPRIVQGITTGTLTATTDVSEIAGCDVYIITVGTPLSEAFEADVSHLREACNAIGPYVAESTSEVYGKNPAVPWDETDDRVLGPTSVDRWSYSSAKAACEHMLF